MKLLPNKYNQKGFLSIVAIFAVVVILALISLGAASYFNRNNPKTTQSTTSSYKNNDLDNAKIVEVNDLSSNKLAKPYIRLNENKLVALEYNGSTNSGTNFIKYANHFIYGYYDKDSGNQYLKTINLNTLEEKTLAEDVLQADFPYINDEGEQQSINENVRLTEFVVIQDRLFVVYTSYFAPTRMLIYNEDGIVNNKKPLQIIDKSFYPSFNYEPLDEMWIQYSIGDGCGSSSEIQKFNIDTLGHYGDILETASWGNFLVKEEDGVFTYLETETDNTIQSVCGTNKLLSLKQTDLLVYKQELISKEEMPDNVFVYELSKDGSKIYFISTEKMYVYDFSTQELSEIGETDFDLNKTGTYTKIVEDNKLCFNDSNTLVDLSTAKVLEYNSEQCKNTNSITPKRPDVNNELIEIINSYSLPKEFTIEWGL